MRDQLVCILGIWLGSPAWAAAIEPPAPAAGVKAPDVEEPHARARLICESTALIPGQVANLAITFTIQKGWHLYWNGLSDSGMPIQIKPVDVPAGYQWLPQIWPAPHRHEPAEGILDHIYEDRVTVILPVRVPPDARPGTRQEFRFNLDWLVCQEACVLEKAGVRVEVPVAARSQPGSDAALFAQTRATAPILPVAGQSAPPPVELAWEDLALTIRFPGAKVLEFYPSTDSSRPSDLLTDGRSESETLTIHLSPKEGETALRVDGMLMARTKDDRVVYSWIGARQADSARSGSGEGPLGRVPASK